MKIKKLPYTLIKIDELHHLSDRISLLENQIVTARDFVKEIEGGNLNAAYKGAGQQDSENALAHSLLSLQQQLKRYNVEENERKWITEGIAQFMDILRANHTEDMSAITDKIISNLVKYLGANQGALFSLEDEDSNDVHLRLVSCYAYERKKFIDKRIELGEGLVGQCALEKENIFLTEIPKDYLNITSGVGQALPSNILLVPLKIEGRIYGVIELASFAVLKKYQVEFVERLAENIASSISTLKINAKTRQLLRETQLQAEQMKEQEEEMRQNMEELSATQEEMHRVLRDSQVMEKYLTELLDSSKDAIMTFDREYRILSANKVVRDIYSTDTMKFEKGFDLLSLYEGEAKVKYKKIFDSVLSGESVEISEVHPGEEGSTHFIISYTPLKDGDGKVVAAAAFARDVTVLVNAENDARKLMEEVQQQNEELKSQEEEMRQNLEELAATQDEINRLLLGSQKKEKYLDELLNASKDSILTIDKGYRIVSGNESIKKMLSGMGIQSIQGIDILSFYPSEEEKKKHIDLYERVFKGEHIELIEQYKTEEGDIYNALSYAPLKDEQGSISMIAIFTKDVTELIRAKQLAEDLVKEAQSRTQELREQEEELRQNMEELSATQEEISRLLSDSQKKEQYLGELINASGDSIVVVNKDLKVINCNEIFKREVGALGFKAEAGLDILSLHKTEEERKRIKASYKKAFGGDAFELLETFNFEGGVVMKILMKYSPLRDEKGKITSVVVFAKNLTLLLAEAGGKK